eukprot:TRINITY_DN12279_c3_g1_i2.p3 TRINITY_DN12279_c3_g1~~TRINITY_DN12279_c3_g1_i2.p3  ORF type:complete len:112 (+),score=3.64 TRINITY_DN12279_c3_g1_i2:533-868(+)
MYFLGSAQKIIQLVHKQNLPLIYVNKSFFIVAKIYKLQIQKSLFQNLTLNLKYYSQKFQSECIFYESTQKKYQCVNKIFPLFKQSIQIRFFAAKTLILKFKKVYYKIQLEI